MEVPTRCGRLGDQFFTHHWVHDNIDHFPNYLLGGWFCELDLQELLHFDRILVPRRMVHSSFGETRCLGMANAIILKQQILGHRMVEWHCDKRNTNGIWNTRGICYQLPRGSLRRIAFHVQCRLASLWSLSSIDPSSAHLFWMLHFSNDYYQEPLEIG